MPEVSPGRLGSPRRTLAVTTRSEAARRAHERRRERDEFLEREIDADLVDVWRGLGPRARAEFKANPYMSRAEAFAHWCHDNGADVASLQIAARENIAGWIRTERDQYDGAAFSGTTADAPTQFDHLPPVVAARLASRAPGSCLAKWGRRPAHRKECPGCQAALSDSPIPF